MGQKKRNTNSGPKIKRYNRSARLLHAPKFLEQYNGKSLVKGYSTYFGVNMLCAVSELEMLGYKYSRSYKDRLKQNEHHKQKVQTERRKREKLERWVDEESDETFACIAGYTEGGAPFGVMWEEIEDRDK